MLAKAAYSIYGALYSGLWQSGLVRPGGNAWHVERAGRHDPRSDRPLWLHAASLGEVQVARAFVDTLLPLGPLYLTVQTETGHAAACEALPGIPVAYAPLDRHRYISEFLSRVAPRGLVVFETEIWPRWLLAFGGPVWFANARLSPRSHRRYRKIRAALRPVFRNVRGVFAQSDQDRARFVDLGVPASLVHVAGQVKQLAMKPAPDPSRRSAWRGRLGVGEQESLWVAGSIRKNEIDLVLEMWSAAGARGTRARLILAPRHLRDVDFAMSRAAKYLPAAARVSALSGGLTDAGPELLVLDTHGELSDLYAAGDLTLLGGTFAPHGGHNPNESARFGVPLVTGPFTANIEADLALLSEAGLAIRLENLDDFPTLAGHRAMIDRGEACRTLAAAISRRDNPVLRLAAAVREELSAA